MESEADRTRTFTRRALVLGGAQATLGTLLVGRMAYLSIFESPKYKLLAEENRVSLRVMTPRRGLILDRFGVPLALNRQNFLLQMIPEQVEDINETLNAVSQYLPLTQEDIDRILRDVDRVPKFMPVEIAHDLPRDQFAALAVRLPTLPGVQPVQGYSRYYPDGPSVAHLVGYVGAPSQEEVKKENEPLLAVPGFKLGKDGLEKSEEARLRGRAGAARVEVNAHGRVVRELDTVQDSPGEELVLTIDRELQIFTAQRLQQEAASAILMSVDTGEILALASVPGFDPNSFSDGISHKEWNTLSSDEKNPLMNKPVRGMYPPGSTFKMITALAGLESGLVSPTDSWFCSGRYKLSSNTWHCHKRRGHGRVSLMSGIYASCDVYFYNVGRIIGPDRIASMARRFGLGQKYDLPIPWQKKGIVPDTAWKRERYDKDWLVGESLNYSIGQGYLLTTPLQLAVMVSRIASGRAIEPKLLRKNSEPELAPFINVNQEHLALVRQAMSDVVNARGGTARGARIKVGSFQLAGKTGTAQVRRITKEERRRGVRKNESLPWRERDHALFVAFAPVENPRYACAIVVDHGGSGSKAAAPVARDILELALKRDPLAQRALLAGAASARDPAQPANLLTPGTTG
jgi:penicillin-binding protein 2